MVTIAAVSVGNYCGMGARYVNALFHGCARNLTIPFRFVCFTDDERGLEPGIGVRPLPPGLDGWYNKLALFRPDAFEAGERVLYIDLDAVILGNLDFLATYDGPFAILRNAWHPQGFNSSVMRWNKGDAEHIWDAWQATGFSSHAGGDQAWIEKFAPNAVRLQNLFPNLILSFKAECARYSAPRSRFNARLQGALAQYIPTPQPPDARIVYFHGQPKPHNCRSRWVGDAWEPAGQGEAGGPRGRAIS